MAYTIAFFGTKPYDESSFTDKNKEFGFEIRYYKGHLNKNNVLLMPFNSEFTFASSIASGTYSIPITFRARQATKFAIVPVPVYKS